MAQQAGAEIIPFQNRKPPGTISGPQALQGADPAAEAQARLVRALRSLDTALAEQRAAVSAWRGTLGQLRTAVHGLGTSVQSYRGSLETLDAKVASLRGEAQRLEQWADDALARCNNGEAG